MEKTQKEILLHVLNLEAKEFEQKKEWREFMDRCHGMIRMGWFLDVINIAESCELIDQTSDIVNGKYTRFCDPMIQINKDLGIETEEDEMTRGCDQYHAQEDFKLMHDEDNSEGI